MEVENSPPGGYLAVPNHLVALPFPWNFLMTRSPGLESQVLEESLPLLVVVLSLEAFRSLPLRPLDNER